MKRIDTAIDPLSLNQFGIFDGTEHIHYGYAETWNNSEIETIYEFEMDRGLIHRVCSGGRCWLELIGL